MDSKNIGCFDKYEEYYENKNIKYQIPSNSRDFTYVYDENGKVLMKFQKTNAKINLFAYDENGNLFLSLVINSGKIRDKTYTYIDTHGFNSCTISKNIGACGYMYTYYKSNKINKEIYINPTISNQEVMIFDECNNIVEKYSRLKEHLHGAYFYHSSANKELVEVETYYEGKKCEPKIITNKRLLLIHEMLSVVASIRKNPTFAKHLESEDVATEIC